MILFASAGSWGEVQPLVALAKHFGGEMACDSKWREGSQQYGVITHRLCGPIEHDFTVPGFLGALDMREIFDSLYAASEGAEAIVSAFFLWPAKIVAELRGIPWIATTVSPIYWSEQGATTDEQMVVMKDWLNAIRKSVDLDEDEYALDTGPTMGLFPRFIGQATFDVVGYPRLPPLHALDASKFTERPYCLISSGSINPHDWIDEVVSACQRAGLYCVYLGSEFERDGAIGLPFEVGFDHKAALRDAYSAVIHAGLGTLCDAIECKTPMIVRPRAFDQFHNAKVLESMGVFRWPAFIPAMVDAEIEPVQHILENAEKLIRGWL